MGTNGVFVVFVFVSVVWVFIFGVNNCPGMEIMS